MGGRTRLKAALGLGFVLLLGELLRSGASVARPPLDFDLGPSTGPYLTGFTESEERLPVTFRWTTGRASLSIPLEASGERATLQIRYARFLPGGAGVRLFLDGAPAGSFTARSGRFRTQELPLPLPSRALRLEILVDDPDPSELGIAVDWIRIEGARPRLPLSSLAPRLLLAGVFALMLLTGFPLWTTVLVSAAAAISQALWFGSAPFAMAHVHDQIAMTGLGASALVALAFWRSRATSARWVPLFFLLGFTLKGGALFHPSYFYPDVRLHRRHLEVFESSEGSIVERGIAAQKAAQTAYPRRVGGRDYAFPYSPVFYVPFTLLDRDARGIESSMKHVGLVLAALELPLVFALARRLVGLGPAIWASLLTVFLPPVVSRLLYAQWPTLAGHVLDLMAIWFAARFAAEPSARPLLLYGASGFLSSLVYVSSLINLTLFTAWLAVFRRKRVPWLLLYWALIAMATVLILYLPFTVAFFSEILPALARGEGGGEGNPAAGAGTTLLRVYHFYGIGFPALALAGLLLARRVKEAWVGTILSVYAASFGSLLALRAVSGTFKDLKELVFAGPLVAVTAGLSLDSLWGRGRSGKAAAALVTIGLVGFGLAKYGEYLRMHTTLAGLR